MPVIDDRTIACAIESALQARAASASVCPSEVARALAPEEAAWRALMPAIRRVAGVLATKGELVATRGAVEVDAESTGGPIRLRKPQT